jgi:hypothetical protein
MKTVHWTSKDSEIMPEDDLFLQKGVSCAGRSRLSPGLRRGIYAHISIDGASNLAFAQLQPIPLEYHLG